jgi:hypothetical protein
LLPDAWLGLGLVLRRVLVGITLVLLLTVGYLQFVNVERVEGQGTLMVTPSSPMAGQPFTLSGTCTDVGGCELVAYLGGACGVNGVTGILFTDVFGPYSVSVPGQPSGSGWAALLGFTGGEVCASFNITSGGCGIANAMLCGRLARDKPPYNKD